MLYIENAQYEDPNALPTRQEVHKAGTGLFFNLMAGLFGTAADHHEPVDPALAKIRRMQAGYDAMNAAARGEVAAVPVGAHVIKVVAEVAQAVVDKVKSASALDGASAWLLDKLQNGPVAATVLERMADDDKIARRTLERARRKLGLTPRRINRRSFWMLPDRESAKD